MSKKGDQKFCVSRLKGIGWEGVTPVGKHRVAAVTESLTAGPIVVVWCVPGLLRHFDDPGMAATWCPKHNPEDK